MKDDINKAMKCSKATLSLWLDFSKPFGAKNFNILIQKYTQTSFFKNIFTPFFWIIYQTEPILYKLIPTILPFSIQILVRINFGIYTF